MKMFMVRGLWLVVGVLCLAGSSFGEKVYIWPEGKMPAM